MKTLLSVSDLSATRFHGSKLFVASSISSNEKMQYGGNPRKGCLIGRGGRPISIGGKLTIHA